MLGIHPCHLLCSIEIDKSVLVLSKTKISQDEVKAGPQGSRACVVGGQQYENAKPFSQ